MSKRFQITRAGRISIEKPIYLWIAKTPGREPVYQVYGSTMPPQNWHSSRAAAIEAYKKQQTQGSEA